MVFSTLITFFVLLVGLRQIHAQVPACTEYNIDTTNACDVACDNEIGTFRTMEMNNRTHIVFVRSCVCNLDLFCLDQIVEREILTVDDTIEQDALLSPCHALGIYSDGQCSHLCDDLIPTNTGYAAHVYDGLLSCRCSLRWGDEPISVCVDSKDDPRDFLSYKSSARVSAATVTAPLFAILSFFMWIL